MIADCKGDSQECTNCTLGIGTFVGCWSLVVFIIVILVEDGAALSAIDVFMTMAVGKEVAA